MQKYEYDPKWVINNAISSEREFCTGYQNPGASGNGYVTTIKLSTGLVDITPWEKVQAMSEHEVIKFDRGCSNIVSYDRCECNDAYIGAINMLTASSFSGLQGVIWGYDIAVVENLRSRKLYDQKWPSGDPNSEYSTPVYSIEPLLNATERLFGHAEPGKRRFNPIPGSMVVCANKSATSDPSSDVKEGWAFSVISLAILENRNSGSNLFIEDCDIIDINNPDGTRKTKEDVKAMLDTTLRKVTECTVLCGLDQHIKYKEIFIGYKVIKFNEKQVGCALACAPYVTLARNAVPQGMKPSKLTDMNISQWENALNLQPLEKIEKSKIGILGMGVLD
ncbi:histidine decarboxylase [Methanosarcina barkeri str. Wiesmoor]|uniref:Histidine decarboxylase n=2 Tax=Methanosarcina barkeri TaxID=2208 RepID=A0A0E3QMN8_METBA|nr:histidine decarboxylase, pyruvoyl type [Methanosarcina barkeri]AKB51010.1 histidine decarboxylase [Methanosarcina barkeri str. Wiesmoor]